MDRLSRTELVGKLAAINLGERVTVVLLDNQLVEPVCAAQACLNPQEMSRFNGFKNSTSQHNFGLSRLLFKVITSTHFKVAPDTLALQLDTQQRLRVFQHDMPLPLAISLSHSKSCIALALCTDADCLLGIDVEDAKKTRAFRAIAQHYFAPDEVARMTSHAEFLALWTQKEALCKALGIPLAELLPQNVQALAITRNISLHTTNLDSQAWTLASNNRQSPRIVHLEHTGSE